MMQDATVATAKRNVTRRTGVNVLFTLDKRLSMLNSYLAGNDHFAMRNFLPLLLLLVIESVDAKSKLDVLREVSMITRNAVLQ